MFKPNARVLKQRYLDEAHAFFEQRGPFAIVLARFVPIVRTLAPITAGAARMNYGIFTLFNVIGALVWSLGLILLGYWLGQFEIIQKLLEPIFILIALASVTPIIIEWYKRRKAARAAGDAPPPSPWPPAGGAPASGWARGDAAASSTDPIPPSALASRSDPPRTRSGS